MGKTVNRKKNIKRRRTIRRTVGALLMVTAITVAAIPIPETQAYDPTVVTDESVKTLTAYVAAKNTDKVTIDHNEDYYDDPSCKKAYTAYQGSDGSWTLDWQFEYKEGSPNGYLSKYNDQYAVHDVNIPFNVYNDFLNVPSDQAQAFYNDVDSGEPITEKVSIDIYSGSTKTTTRTVYSLNYIHPMAGDPTDASSDAYKNKAFFEKEFYSDYEAYKVAYEAWKNDTADPKTHEKPQEKNYSISLKCPTENDQMAYLCASLFGTGLKLKLANGKLRNYNSAGEYVAPDSKVKIVLMTEKTTTDNSVSTNIGDYYTAPFTDNAGNMTWCLAKDSSSIGYIGQKAFYGVGNVDTLTMADEISVIGDSAFENSFIKTVTLSPGCAIGNRSFANCKYLEKVEINDGTTKVGAEAFEGSSIPSVSFPTSVFEIGYGAFNNCGGLKSVTFADSTSGERSIKDYAFYNCINLSNVALENAHITKIGKCAFALKDEEKSKLTNFVFPYSIENGTSDIGDYVLYNRKNLEYVKLPTNLSSTKLNDTILYGCINLGCLEFPDELGSTTYDSDDEGDGSLFYTIRNDKFYVRGPELNSSKSEASPRICTWAAISNAKPDPDHPGQYIGNNVPYVYNKDGKDYYEISDGTYVMAVSPDGELTKCNFVQGKEKDVDVTIPSEVAGKQIKSIAQDCFKDNAGNPGKVLERMKSLEIADNSGINSVADNAFSGAAKLERVILGNTITSIGANGFSDCPVLKRVDIGEGIGQIGASAFENCPSLNDIYFDNPGTLTEFTIEDIDENAFNVGSDKLTLHGEIGSNYAPFKYSMSDTTYADATTGLRVCYKTPLPSSLTVILDNCNGLATLVDIPHYEDIEYYHDLYDSDHNKYEDYKTYFDLCNDLKAGNDLSIDEQDALKAIYQVIIPEGVESIDVQGYISNKSKNPDNYPARYNNDKNKTTYLNYGPDGSADPFFGDYSSYGLFNGYCGSQDSPEQRDYSTDNTKELYYDSNANKLETLPIGNDRVTKVVMNDVKYLPDKAFNSCEQLQSVTLGDDLKDPGTLPFYGCTNLLEAIGNNDVYSANGILYKNNSDGSKTLVECFASRGYVVGSNMVSTDYDPELATVDDIADAAFEDCDGIRFVDLSNTSDKLTTIPENCFKDSDNIRTVNLPENIETIEKNAFADIDSDVEVVAHNEGVYLDGDAFGDFEGKSQPYYTTYKNSNSYKTAKKKGVNVDNTLPDNVTVIYICGRGGNIENGIVNVIDTESVPINGNPKGLTEKQREAHETEHASAHLGYKFASYDGYKDARDITVTEDRVNSKKQMFVTVIYDKEGGEDPDATPSVSPSPGSTTPGSTTPGSTTPGTTTPTVTGGSSGNKYNLKVVYGRGSGQYSEGTEVLIEAIDAPEGKEFDKWVMNGSGATIESSTSKATTLKMGSSDVTVTATYKNKTAASSNNGGGSRNSTGTTNRNGTNSGTSSRNGNNGTTIDITKPGVSNTDKAYASVSGSTDSFIVRVTESADAANRVATALAAKYPDMSPIKYFAMDISLYDSTGTNKITDTTGLSVNITMPIPDALAQYAGNNMVGAVNDSNTLEDLACKFTSIDGIPCVSFTATHFSPYTIYVDTANLTSGTIDYTPKTGDAIHPKWFVALALAATSLFLFFKRDKKIAIPKTV